MRKKLFSLSMMSVVLSLVVFNVEADWVQVGCPEDADGKNAKVWDFEYMNDVLYVATNAGVWKSEDYGDNWDSIGLAISAGSWTFPVYSLATHDGTLYAAGRSVYRYSGSGTQWEQIGGDLATSCNNPLVRLAAHDNSLFASVGQCTEAGVYKLTNFSGTWDNVAGVQKFGIWSDGDRVYAARTYSTDAGATWQNTSGIGGIGAVYAYEKFGGYYYASAYPVSTTGSIYRSTDGVNFSGFWDGLYRYGTAFAFEPMGDTLFCLVDGIDSEQSHVYCISSGMTRWQPLGSAFPWSFDEGDLQVLDGQALIAGVNGTHAERLPGGSFIIHGGWGIYRYDFDPTAAGVGSAAANSAAAAGGTFVVYNALSHTMTIDASGASPIDMAFYRLDGTSVARATLTGIGSSMVTVPAGSYLPSKGVYLCRVTQGSREAVVQLEYR